MVRSDTVTLVRISGKYITVFVLPHTYIYTTSLRKVVYKYFIECVHALAHTHTHSKKTYAHIVILRNINAHR